MSGHTRIAYFVSRYPAVHHTFILREILALRSLGFDIKVIAIRGDDRSAERMTAVERLEREHTFAVLPFGRHFLEAHVVSALRAPRAYLAGLSLACRLGGLNVRSLLSHVIYFAEAVVAGHEVLKGGYRHIHTHFSSTVALLAARLFGFDLSVTIHGPGEFRDVLGFHMREKVACAKFISTISRYARSQTMLASDPKDWHKIEICRLGVDPFVFSPGYRGRPGNLRVICVARLVPAKAQRLLIAACGQLISAGWNLRLHLVGSGPDLYPLREFAASAGVLENVIFEGDRKQEEVISLYRKADVFAIASFAEGVPVALMEAMAMQIPCVATRVNGIPELISDRKEGLLVDPSNVEELAKAIETLLSDPGLRRRLGIAGRQKVMRDYHLGTNVALLARLFQTYVGDTVPGAPPMSRKVAIENPPVPVRSGGAPVNLDGEAMDAASMRPVSEPGLARRHRDAWALVESHLTRKRRSRQFRVE